jgi:hypothetical protein
MLTFNKNIFTVITLGSLLSAGSIQAVEYKNLILALPAAAATYYLVGHHEVTNSKDANDKSLGVKLIDIASKVAKAPIDWYNKKKDAIHLAQTVGIAVYYGPEAINSVHKIIDIFQFKGAPIVSAWVNAVFKK